MKIAVIGAGIAGLTSTITAQEAGHQVSIYSDRTFDQTTSSRAAASFKPYQVAHNELSHRLIQRSWLKLKEIERKSPEAAVRPHTHWEASSSPRALDRYTEVMERFEEVQFPNVPGGYAYGWRYGTFFMDVPVLLPWLMNKFLAAGGSVNNRHFTSIAEWEDLPADAIINCTGLGARELCGDRAVRPAKGQWAIVDRQPNMDWSITADGFSVYPRGRDTLLGGTTEWDVETETTDSSAVQLIVNANRRILGHLTPESVKGSMAGVRPYREGGVRLEAETLGNQRVVHNYGYGGAGFTLAWGGAEEAVALIDR